MSILWHRRSVVKWLGGMALQLKLKTWISYPINRAKAACQFCSQRWRWRRWLWVVECLKAIIVELITQIVKNKLGL